MTKLNDNQLPSGCSVTGHYVHITIAIILSFSGLAVFLDVYRGPQSVALGFGLLLYSVFGIIYSTKGIKKIRRYEKLQRQRKLDTQILELSISNKGVLFPSTVSIALEITIEEAKQILDGYVARGVAELEVTSEGKVLYKFSEMSN